jgi:transcriptional regulator GlxA family with amidase domain
VGFIEPIVRHHAFTNHDLDAAIPAVLRPLAKSRLTGFLSPQASAPAIRTAVSAILSAMRRVLLTGIPPLEIQDLAGPLEVFSRTEGYHVEVASPYPDGSMGINAGLKVAGGVFYKKVTGPVDTLWLVGGPEAPSGIYPPAYLEWLRSMCADARRVAASCLGTFVLAAAGVLKGKRVVTHWQWCDNLAQRHPDVSVDRFAIFTKDGNVYTSAGISTGIDLALSFVEDDFGRPAALAMAKWLVLYVRRTGAQVQLSRLLEAQATWTNRFDRLQEWILEHLADDLNVDALAAAAGMSPRHFARVFHGEKGVTPARFVERLRVEAAGRMLAESEAGLKETAAAYGFGSADSMARSFVRVKGLSPREFASSRLGVQASEDADGPPHKKAAARAPSQRRA